MLVILFRSKLTATAGDEYAQMAAEMDAHARTFEGFIDVKAYTAADGERLTVVWWRDEESLAVWRNDLRHRIAQQSGRARWYEYYKMDVAEVVRQKDFTARESEVTEGTLLADRRHARVTAG
jgi:heme-degrading monooxygenase HmoA